MKGFHFWFRFSLLSPALAMLVFLVFPLTAEVRLSVDAEFYNTLVTDTSLNEWSYSQSGTAGLSFFNKGSRMVRGELSLDFEEASQSGPGESGPGESGPGESGPGESGPGITLRKFYIRPAFGNVLVTLGKSRSTWGAGLIFNAGDLIFGSDSTDFDMASSDPRSQTAWLTNAEIPLGDFSFFELIVLPGKSGASAITPPLDQSSAGARISLELGDFNIQTGYLYRGDTIAGLGSPGHKAFVSLEGIAPLNWHLSSSLSAATDPALWSASSIEESWMLSGGAFYDHRVGYNMDLSWRGEFLSKPLAQGSPLSFYPSISLAPLGNLVFTLASVISATDGSARSTLSASWNIYEALTLLGYFTFPTGEGGELSCTLGGRYSY